MSELKSTALGQFHKDVDKSSRRTPESQLREVFRPLRRPLHRHPRAAQERPCADAKFLEDSLVTTLRHVSGETISSTSNLILSEGRNKTAGAGVQA